MNEGAWLPDVDPHIAEIVLSTLKSNPTASPAQLLVALVQEAPHQDVAVELASALMEVILCREKGHLYWLTVNGHSILVGARQCMQRSAMVFGNNVWPHVALMIGSPQSVTIETAHGRKRVWIATEDMTGVVIRQSEAIALGNALVETFGGRIVEDRSGPEVLRDAFIEKNMTKRAQARATAISTVERMSIERAHQSPQIHAAMVAMAEAIPGTCQVGDVFVPEDGDIEYRVESRINDSWVSLVSQDDRVVEASAWVKADGSPPIEGAPIHWGFSDTSSVVVASRFASTPQ